MGVPLMAVDRQVFRHDRTEGKEERLTGRIYGISCSHWHPYSFCSWCECY